VTLSRSETRLLPSPAQALHVYLRTTPSPSHLVHVRLSGNVPPLVPVPPHSGHVSGGLSAGYPLPSQTVQGRSKSTSRCFSHPVAASCSVTCNVRSMSMPGSGPV